MVEQTVGDNAIETRVSERQSESVAAHEAQSIQFSCGRYAGPQPSMHDIETDDICRLE